MSIPKPAAEVSAVSKAKVTTICSLSSVDPRSLPAVSWAAPLADLFSQPCTLFSGIKVPVYLWLCLNVNSGQTKHKEAERTLELLFLECMPATHHG